MTTALLITLLVIAVALLFDFVNGFHDAANSIATIVSTRVLTPVQAVMMAAFFNFAALFVFDTGVAKTVGNGMIVLDMVTPMVIACGLAGAVVWGLITWWMKLPTSSSHALMGGYAGAAMTHAGLVHGWSHAGDVIIANGWTKTILFIALAPVLGFAIARFLSYAVRFLLQQAESRYADKAFRILQLFSAAFLSLMHGSNDAQKTAGIITGALVAGGVLSSFAIPSWVLWTAYTTMGLGTLAGGWRIVHTMGRRLTHLKPSSGFYAESAAALSIFIATECKMPVSTTHATTGAILGVGSAQRVKAVRWGVAGDILQAWVLTIPAAAILAGLLYAIAQRFAPTA